jgi:hypothetical protein
MQSANFFAKGASHQAFSVLSGEEHITGEFFRERTAGVIVKAKKGPPFSTRITAVNLSLIVSINMSRFGLNPYNERPGESSYQIFGRRCNFIGDKNCRTC